MYVCFRCNLEIFGSNSENDKRREKQYNCIVFSVYNVYYMHEERKMKFKELEKILLKDGWFLIDIKGSHYQYKHKNKRLY